MSKNIQDALKESLQDIVDAGLTTTFTNKRLNELGVQLPIIKVSPSKIKKVRFVF